MNQPVDYRRPRAKIVIPFTHLHQLLNLAGDVRITDVTTRADMQLIEVHLEGDRFPLVEPMDESLVVHLAEAF